MYIFQTGYLLLLKFFYKFELIKYCSYAFFTIKKFFSHARFEPALLASESYVSCSRFFHYQIALFSAKCQQFCRASMAIFFGKRGPLLPS